MPEIGWDSAAECEVRVGRPDRDKIDAAYVVGRRITPSSFVSVLIWTTGPAFNPLDTASTVVSTQEIDGGLDPSERLARIWSAHERRETRPGPDAAV